MRGELVHKNHLGSVHPAAQGFSWFYKKRLILSKVKAESYLWFWCFQLSCG